MRSFGVLMFLTGCAATAVRVAPERVQHAEALPGGYVAIGRVVASCSSLGGFQATDGEPLASFDCGRARLERVLAEEAGDAGGDLLVGTSCGRDASVLRCSATAARPEEPRARIEPPDSDRGPVPGARAIGRWDEPRASASLVIRVDFEPSVERFERRGRAAADVAEVAQLPVSHRELGMLTTRCDEDECELRELRHGLRVAAGGLGASDLVGVRCFGRNDVRECVASVAAAELDE
jgi:hypothetical protein